MKLAAKRNFEVKYYEKDENIWVVESHLEDSPHDITIKVEIDMINFIITDTECKFDKFPMAHCNIIEDKIKSLIGLKVDTSLMHNAMNRLMGPEGCPNIISLLMISVPGIIYYYYPYKIKTGRMKAEEFEYIIKTDLKNACLGHTLQGNEKINDDWAQTSHN